VLSALGRRDEKYMLANFNKVLKDHWRNLINGFWFVPGLVSLLGPLLALFFLSLDHHVGREDQIFLFSGGAAEASTILSTIAGSLITVVGLTFSITIVVLQLVSSQYTPRALRGFLRDRITQVVAGGFAAISAYCLIVLTTVQDSSSPDHSFLPAISITVAMGLGFLGLVLLLIFIHHAGSVIQVADITARLAMQTMRTIDLQSRGWMSEPLEEGVSPLVRTRPMEEVPARLRATHPGYVQRIALSHLVRVLQRPGLQLHLLVCPGDFVTEETVIAEVWPAEAADEVCRRAILHSVYIERERDVTQDARFGVRQLADIALRALSPAVNDPTTGVLCIKYLQAVFERFVRRQPQPSIFHLANGASILEIRQPAFQEYLEVFLEIGHYAGGNTRIINTLLTALKKIMEAAALLNIREYQDLLTEITSTLASKSMMGFSVAGGG
jgi:uncharacterized membrane protein